MTNSSAEPKAYGTSRLVCLDGLRGVAAFCVAVFHQNHTLLPGGNLAVDFFFVLSGFVLQRSYEPRFATGLTADRFARLRVARLAPLFWVGLLLGVVNVVQGVLRHSAHHMPAREMLLAVPFNVALFPAPWSVELFPLNNPAWSLFFEIAINVVMACVLIKWGKRRLLATLVISFILLAISGIVTPPSETIVSDGLSMMSGGHSWPTLHIGIFRTIFSFTMGFALARYAGAGAGKRNSNGVMITLAAVLVLVMALHLPAPVHLAYDLAVIFAVLPMLVWLGSRFEPSGAARTIALFIGDISFAVYAIHLPIMYGSAFVIKRLHLPVWGGMIVFLLPTIAAAWVCVRYLDVPMRRALARRLGV